MRTHRKCTRAGFTLVELLAAIAIIALLIGILVPAIGAVRKQARKTSTSATLQSISTGLESYKTDSKLGGQYPPSRSDRGGTGLAQLQVQSPYFDPGDEQPIEITGAGLLVWALAGADFLGTPGFRVVNPQFVGRTTWAQWTGNELSTNSNPEPESSLYAIHDTGPNNGQPVHKRYGPYVALDKMKLSTRVVGVSPPSFEFENDSRPRSYPMFLDSFGNPILYWRADPAGKQLIDRVNNNQTIATGVDRGIYHWMDNGPLLEDLGGQDEPLATGDAHKLGWKNPTSYSPTALPEGGTFAAYILNQDAKAKLMPQRPDSYLLVSPGADGVYGTGDDVTNFDPTGN